MQANRAVSAKAECVEVRAYKQEIQTLERELLRKEKALAEAAALLVLEKKVRTLFADRADARSPSSNASASTR